MPKPKKENKSAIVNKTLAGNNGVSIMTQAASQQGDESKKLTGKPKREQNYLHSIREPDDKQKSKKPETKD